MLRKKKMTAGKNGQSSYFDQAMIRQYQHFNSDKASVRLLYKDASLHLALCRYRRPSEDELFMPSAAITYVQEGEKVIFMNGEKYEMKAGDALFIPKNTILYSDISVRRKPFVSLNTLISDGQFSEPDLLGCMACRITENLRLEHYAASGHMSLSTFKRWFLKNVGHSPAQWIIERRLERARYLLLHKQLPVNAACFESGFNDVSYFIGKYRQRFGVTPGGEKK